MVWLPMIMVLGLQVPRYQVETKLILETQRILRAADPFYTILPDPLSVYRNEVGGVIDFGRYYVHFSMPGPEVNVITNYRYWGIGPGYWSQGGREADRSGSVDASRVADVCRSLSSGGTSYRLAFQSVTGIYFLERLEAGPLTILDYSPEGHFRTLTKPPVELKPPRLPPRLSAVKLRDIALAYVLKHQDSSVEPFRDLGLRLIGWSLVINAPDGTMPKIADHVRDILNQGHSIWGYSFQVGAEIHVFDANSGRHIRSFQAQAPANDMPPPEGEVWEAWNVPQVAGGVLWKSSRTANYPLVRVMLMSESHVLKGQYDEKSNLLMVRQDGTYETYQPSPFLRASILESLRRGRTTSGLPG